MAKKKKILIISLGSIGERHLRNTRILLPTSEIGVLRRQGFDANTTPKGADIQFHQLDEAISYSPDAVIIASPANFHLNDATPFINNHKNVFIEKPLSSCVKNLDGFLEKAIRSKGFIMVGYILRFLPTLQKIKKIVEVSQLGRIYHAYIQVGQYLPDWRPSADYRKGVSAQAELGGGVLLELSHELDYATWLFGHPDHVYCRLMRSSDLEINTEDNAHIVFEYNEKNNNKTVVLQLDFLQRSPQMTLQIVGSDATLKADLISETITLLGSNDSKEIIFKPEIENINDDPYLKQFDYFFSKCFHDYKPKFSIANEKIDIADINQATKIMKLIENARLSNNLGAHI